jgi:sporulation protein YlmC with PRC-barrel domain
VKKTASVLTASLLALSLAATASAQTRPATDPTTPKQSTTGSEPQRQTWAPEAGAIESSRLVGMKVKSAQGKDVGEISQLIVDHSSGKITHVVVGKGGVLGVGEQRVALGWSDVKIQPDTDSRNRMVAVVEQSKLDGAPRYEARRDMPAASPASSPSSTDKK